MLTSQDKQEIQDIIDQQLHKDQFEVAKIASHEHNGTDANRVSFKNLINSPNYFCVATPTNGTAAVNVFGSGGFQYPFTATGIYLIANDTTAGNISVYNSGATVATIAKGTVSGVMTGATSLSHSTYTVPNTFTVASDSTGNATVFMTFTI